MLKVGRRLFGGPPVIVIAAAVEEHANSVIRAMVLVAAELHCAAMGVNRMGERLNADGVGVHGVTDDNDEELLHGDTSYTIVVLCSLATIAL